MPGSQPATPQDALKALLMEYTTIEINGEQVVHQEALAVAEQTMTYTATLLALITGGNAGQLDVVMNVLNYSPATTPNPFYRQFEGEFKALEGAMTVDAVSALQSKDFNEIARHYAVLPTHVVYLLHQRQPIKAAEFKKKLLALVNQQQ